MNGDCLKFRVWDKKDKEYLDPDYYEAFCLMPDGKVHVGMTVENGLYDEYRVIPPQQLIVEQCTGLKDKNGKLIYENDIVQYNDQECGTVLFRDGCWVWDWKVNDPPLYMLEQKYLKVVGNIHEVKNECTDK